MVTHTENIKHLDITVFIVFPGEGEEQKAARWLDGKCRTTRENPERISEVNGYCMKNACLFGIYIAPDAEDCYETIFHEVYHTVVNILGFLQMKLDDNSEVPALLCGKLCRRFMDIYYTKVE